MEVRQTTDRGRGVFATRSYTVGELVWRGEPVGWSGGGGGGGGGGDGLCDVDAAIASHISLPADLQGGDDYERERYNAMAVEAREVELACLDFPLPPRMGYVPEHDPMHATHAESYEGDVPVTAVYHYGSYFNHSCLHNCSRSFRGLSLSIRANRIIEAGEEMTIAYCSRYLPLAQRGAVFADFDFSCTCPRCVEQAVRGDDRDPRIRQFMSTRASPEAVVDLCPLPALNMLILRSAGEARQRWIERLLQMAELPDDLTIGCCLLLLREFELDQEQRSALLDRLLVAWRVRTADDGSYAAFAQRYGQSDAAQEALTSAAYLAADAERREMEAKLSFPP